MTESLELDFQLRLYQDKAEKDWALFCQSSDQQQWFMKLAYQVGVAGRAMDCSDGVIEDLKGTNDRLLRRLLKLQDEFDTLSAIHQNALERREVCKSCPWFGDFGK